jgi:hypothetical protein
VLVTRSVDPIALHEPEVRLPQVTAERITSDLAYTRKFDETDRPREVSNQ